MAELESLRWIQLHTFALLFIVPITGALLMHRLGKILAELRKLNPSPASPKKEKEAGL